jgi:putative FmdB family regulatory protein
MPEYTYECDPEEGGCGYLFSVVQSFGEYKQLKRCPECRKHKLIRAYDIDQVNTSVKLGDEQLTLNHLAHRNSSRMSSDQKDALTRKHNKYRENEKGELPKGMKRMKKETEKPWYHSSKMADVRNMTETQQQNYIRTGKKHG